MTTPEASDRRGFLLRVLGLSATVGMPSCSRARRDFDTATLNAMLDTFIPADEDPGAIEAGVPAQILARAANDPVTARRYLRLTGWVAEHALAEDRRRFDELSPSRREALLRELYESRDAGRAQLRIDLQVALMDCYQAFYSSPAALRAIGYHPPIAGGYPDYAEPPTAIR